MKVCILCEESVVGEVRILLSFGFAIPYNKLDRSESDPRVRLSHRIQKYFQKNEK